VKVPLTLVDFLHRAGLHAGRAAVVDDPLSPAPLGTISGAGLERRAWGMAGELARLGVAPGERVAIVSPNCARMVIALFGVSGFGRVLVPINFRLNADEVAFIVRHTGARVLLVDAELDPALAGVGAERRIVMDGEADAALFAEADEPPADWAPDEDALASINYTSGTTSRPKGVALTHRTLWLHAMSLGWHLGVSLRDAYLQAVPLFHCNGWGLPYGMAAMGCPQVQLRRVDGEEMLGRIAAHSITLTCGAPAVLDAMVRATRARRERGEDLPGGGTLRVLSGGAPPPRALIAAIEELGWEFIHGYGLTESSPLLTLSRLGRERDEMSASERARRLARQGKAVIGVRLVVDGHGEVLARSNHVFDRYWEDPGATATAIGDGWLHTGDGGGLDVDHSLILTDRRKDVIVTGGESVSSIEIEDVLLQHPGVAEVAVIGVPDARWGETPKALVVPHPGTSPEERDLIAFAREHLAHFKCPTSVEIRDALPRTATGKLQKSRLRAPYWEAHEPPPPRGVPLGDARPRVARDAGRRGRATGG
jgi:acyl-CoA synthetase (AMP-forming)/AMP-acid ligase II